MLKRYLFFLFSFLLICKAMGQTVETDSLVAFADHRVNKIENEKDWDLLDEFQIENFNAKKASLTLYYKEGKLQKMVLESFNPYYKTENAYYIENGNLICVLEKRVEYNAVFNGEAYEASMDKVYQTLSYFQNDKLVKQTDNMDSGHHFSKVYLEAMGESIVDDYRALLSLLVTKDKD